MWDKKNCVMGTLGKKKLEIDTSEEMIRGITSVHCHSAHFVKINK